MMRREEYNRYYEQLTSKSMVTFQSSKELIAFLSGLFSMDYLYHLNLCEKAAATPVEKDQIENRKFTEMQQVRTATRDYLEKYMAKPEGILNKIREKLGYTKAPLVIDVFSNKEFYEMLLGKIGHNGTPDKVFAPSVRYTVNGNTLRRQVL